MKTVGINPSYEKAENILKFAKQFYTGYLATIPKEIVDFDLKKMIIDFEDCIKGINPDNKIMISSERAKTQDFHDNNKLLAFILSSPFSMALQRNQAVILKCIMATEPDGDNIRLEAYMEFQPIESGQHDLNDFYDDEKLKLLNTLYNELCKVFKGNLYIDKKGDKLSIKIQVLLATCSGR